MPSLLLNRQNVSSSCSSRSTRCRRLPATFQGIQRNTVASAGVSRRDLISIGEGVLLANVLGAGLAPAVHAEEQRYLPVSQLAVFQKQDQRQEFRLRAEAALREVLTGADAPLAVRLAFQDAATYDIATKTGGADGSIVLSEELNRPENAMLKPLVEKLAAAKKVIDEGNLKLGSQPISWADTIYLAGKVATQTSWNEIKVKGTKGGMDTVRAFNSEWPAVLGRVDGSSPAPASRIPTSDAPVEEIKAFMGKLGAKPGGGGGPFAPKAPFWERPAFVVWPAAQLEPEKEEQRLAAADPAFAEFKKKYDISKRTVTRTDYEVDFAEYYNRLTSLGATFESDAYLHPIPLQAFKL